MDNRILIGAITAVVVVVMLGSVLMPVIDDATTGKSESNPDAGWIRMNYDTAAGSAYTVTITPGDDGITVANGSDTQTGSDDTIFYADSNVAVWMQDGTVNILGQNTDGPQFLQPEEAITVTRTAEGVTVASGGDSLSFAAPAWAYVPFSSGSYGYFTDGTAVKTNSPMAAVGGGFAGVYAYNDITRYAGLGLQLQTVMEDGKLTGAYWAKPAAADSLSITPFDPGSITIQPLDPSILDPEPDVTIMSVPTPTYTDGDWGYDVIQVDGVDKAAIVSYSGAGGDIVVPATVGGYDVYKFGKRAYTEYSNVSEVFTNSNLASNSTITFPDGLVDIGAGALYNCSKFTGSLDIPDSVKYIGGNAFYATGFTSLELPDSLIYIGYQAFKNCSSLANELIIPGNVETIEDSAFNYCTNITGRIVLPDTLTYLGEEAFRSCYKLTGLVELPPNLTTLRKWTFMSAIAIDTIVIPETITSMRLTSINGCYGLKTLIIASDATPLDSATSSGLSGLTDVLDLSSAVDYSVDRYGIPAGATVQDNIGDSAGYITFVEIGGDAPLNEGAKQILMAVPVLVIFALIAAAIVIFLKRSY